MQNRFLEPVEINRESIMKLFDCFVLETERVHDADEDTFCCKDMGWKFYVRVDMDRELISFHCPMGIRQSASMKKKLSFVNHVSKNYILVNLVLLNEGSMLVEYQFLYDGGVSTRFLMHSFRRFAEIAKEIGRAATRKKLHPFYDEDEDEDEDPFNLFGGQNFDSEPGEPGEPGEPDHPIDCPNPDETPF